MQAVEPRRRIDGIDRPVLLKAREDLLRKRSFGPPDLARLRALLASAGEVVPVREAFERRATLPGRLIALRHDMDHDVENSVRFAEWEARNGFRATYEVLHTDWYYRRGSLGRPSRFVLRALDRIAGLGHEIALHNNAITVALLQDRDPFEILEEELSHLRRHGFEIVGSVAHGDRLCRDLGFNNSELFVECPDPSGRDPQREIVRIDPVSGRRTAVRLAPVPMARFGLTHEAMVFGNVHYLSDTGGRWHRPFDEVAAAYARQVDRGIEHANELTNGVPQRRPRSVTGRDTLK
ncbi:MAG: hypothetical protein HW391_595 [Chloroflexi bacterium]|nr:hypothetical protein [Chloroflexota bacterium]